MADGSASEALQAYVQYMEMPLVDGRCTVRRAIALALQPHPCARCATAD
jgi:hypothetical protein